MEAKNQSIFMQMHNGTRTGEGSFNQGLKDLFYIAGQSNRRKLVDAFPEFFGDEVPEFGIVNKSVSQVCIGNGNIQIGGQMIQKKVKYKGWLIKWDTEQQLYLLYTPDEMEQPAGFREPETEAATIAEAKRFIDTY